MARAKPPTPLGLDDLFATSDILPSRTPGPLGMNDASDPGCIAFLGNTPGSTGIDDGSLGQISASATSKLHVWDNEKVSRVLSPLGLQHIDLVKLKKNVQNKIDQSLFSNLAKLGKLPKLIRLSKESATDILLKLRMDKKNKKSGAAGKDATGNNINWGGISDWGGWCATAVSLLFYQMTGSEMSGDGKDWDNNMSEAVVKGDIPYQKEANPDYNNLPDGSVLIWTEGGGGYGHVCVVVDGEWCSDFLSPPGRQMAGSPKPNAVYVPTG